MTAEQLKDLEDMLWQATDKLRIDSGLKRFTSTCYNCNLSEIIKD